MKNKIVLTALILSMIALIFSGCVPNPVVPSNSICPSADEEVQKIISKLNLSSEDLGYYSCDELKDALNKKISSDGNFDLTYKEFILNAIYEEELVEDCLSQPFDKDFGKWNNNLNNIQNSMSGIISEQFITGMLEVMGMSTLSIGISGLYLAADLLVIGNMISDLKEIFFRKSLHNYILSRKEDYSHVQSWPPYNHYPISAQCNNESTETFFQNIWYKYGDSISDDVNDLDYSFKVEQHNMLKELILQALILTSNTYTITASAGSHGWISPSGDVSVIEGSDQSFTITPYTYTNYQIDDVLVDGSSVGTVSSYTFNNVTEDHTISATFIEETSDQVVYVPDDYATIQEAVDSASSGNTIIVRDGIYNENVYVNKDNLTIRSENGAGSTFVQANNPDGNVFDIRIDNITINGFTAKGATGYINGEPGSGIYLQGANYCTLINNNIINDRFGIFLKDSDNCNISDNTILELTTGCGIYLLDSLKNNIENNNSSNNHQGIFLERSNGNEITGNNVNSSTTGNGVSLYSSDNNTVMKNTMKENWEYDISSSHSSTNNIIYLNDLQNGYSENSNEFWNSPEEISYIYKGKKYTNCLGNFWEYYIDSDVDNDGIWDNPSIINSDKDYYPLVESFENYYF